MKVMGRISPAQEARLFAPPALGEAAPKTQQVLERLKPTIDAMVGKSGRLQLRVESTTDFAALYPELRDKGFWMMMNPNPADQRLPTGHATIIVGDYLFNRLSDDLGEHAMRSIRVDEVAGIFTNSKETPYAVLQFYELTPSSLEILKKYFHDRVWNYHANLKEWRTSYERLPLGADNKTRTDCENCSLFSWSFLDPKWTKQVPELAQVQAEVGPVLVDQIPLQQLYNNTRSPAYRGTVLVSKDAELTETLLKDGSFSEDVVGAQTLFHDFKKLR